MTQSRPATLTSLADAYKNCKSSIAAPIINLMGIVVDVLPPMTNMKTGGASDHPYANHPSLH